MGALSDTKGQLDEALSGLGYKDLGGTTGGDEVNLPLLMLGAGMAGSKSPFFGTALGEGLQMAGKTIAEQRTANLQREALKSQLLKSGIENMHLITVENMRRAELGIPPINIGYGIGDTQGQGAAAPGQPTSPLGFSTQAPATGGALGMLGGKSSQKGAAVTYSGMSPEELMSLSRRYEYMGSKVSAEELAKLATAGLRARQEQAGKDYLDLTQGPDGTSRYSLAPGVDIAKLKEAQAKEGFLVGPNGQIVDPMSAAKAARAGRVAGSEAWARMPAEVAGHGAKANMDLVEGVDAEGRSVKLPRGDVAGLAVGRGGGAAGPSGAFVTKDPLTEALNKDTAEQVVGLRNYANSAPRLIARLEGMADVFKDIQSGSFQTKKAEIAQFLRDNLGMENAENMLNTDAAAVQKIVKSNIAQSFEQLKAFNPRATQMEFQAASQAFANPDLDPLAARKILADDLATAKWELGKLEGFKQSGGRDWDKFITEYNKGDGLSKLKKAEYERIGPFAGERTPPSRQDKNPDKVISGWRTDPSLRKVGEPYTVNGKQYYWGGDQKWYTPEEWRTRNAAK